MYSSKFEAFYVQLEEEFPKVQILYKKDSNFLLVIDALLRLISFGTYKDFLTSYTTTIGQNIYVSENWDILDEGQKISILRHERVHLRQAKKYGRVLFSFLYLVPFFPIGLAYFRTKFEQEAYAETIRADIQYYGTSHVLTQDFKEFVVSQFVSASYLWAWPFRRSIENWFDNEREKAILEYISKHK